jgi:dipeptidyl aminopeptidase/acylaminoacyl peptidase
MGKKILMLFVLALAVVAPISGQKYTIQQYLNIRSSGSPTFSPDGRSIAFLSNGSGTNQIWIVPTAGGEPRQLTNFEDNVGFVRWLADGTGLVFGKAKGGDENTQFLFIRADATGMRELTTDPTVRNNFGRVSWDGKFIYYGSNKRNRSFFDIYRMEIATGKDELLHQSDWNNDVAAVNDSGSKVVVSRSGIEQSLDNDLYLVDTRTKNVTHITPHTGPSEFGSVHFLADGIVLTTNDKREFEGLAYMRKKNAAGDDWSAGNRETRIIDDQQWDVGSVSMTAYPSVMAYTINREGYSELYLRRVETGGKPLISTFGTSGETVKLPARGIVSSVTFSPDQTKLAFSFSSSVHNSDVWVYEIGKKALTQVTASDRSGIDPSSLVAPELVKYKTFDGREIPAWYYRPRPKGSGSDSIVRARRLPVILNVHGGPEGQERPGFSPLTQYYLSRGYAVFAPNVRGSTGYGKTYTHLDDVRRREDSVKDLAYGVEWLKANGGADPRRIAVTGGSYGGYMTLAAITLYPDLWAAAVNTVGIVNWETFLRNTSGYRRRQREVEYGKLDSDLEFLRSISPIAKIDRIKTPLFVIHGRNDPRVPYTEAEQVVDALKKRNAVVEYKLYPDEGHGISKLKNRLELYPLVADFLDRHMK